MINENKKDNYYDLEERTAKFGEDVIDFCRSLPRNDLTRPMINQLIRAGTGIGGNYCEADCAETKKDFEHKMGVANKEAKESKHWLRMIAHSVPEKSERAMELAQEAKELNLIFITIIRNSKNNTEQQKISK